MNKYILPKKSALRRLKTEDFTKPLPDLKNVEGAKATAIAKWIMEWIEEEFKKGTVDEQTVLPLKADLAYMLGVSIGTMQNALRQVEDNDYVESKQCIGTILRNPETRTKNIRKLTSKRDITIKLLKRHIKKNYKAGAILPTTNKLARAIGCTPNSTKLALQFLTKEKVVTFHYKNIKEVCWTLLRDDFEVDESTSTHETLVDKVANDLKDYIAQNMKVGDRLPAHGDLTETLKVSIKTIHDALVVLVKEGILRAKRGRYGTTVIRMPNDIPNYENPETSRFSHTEDSGFYHYEKTQEYIKKTIRENHKVGDRLPSILTFSHTLNLSPNTVRKAIRLLAKEGYLTFMRGRYGGTYVVEIPPEDEETYKWLAVNPQYTQVYHKKSGFETDN